MAHDWLAIIAIYIQYRKNILKMNKIVQKNRDPANIIINLINYIIKNVERASTARARESRDFHVRGTK